MRQLSAATKSKIDELIKEKNMRIAFRVSRSLVACVLFLASAVGFSQTRLGDVVVNVPFDFVAARQHLPAGRYIFVMQADTIKIVQPQGRSIFVPTLAGVRSNDEGTKLVFHGYGDTYFLSAVCVNGKRTIREFFTSSAESELAKSKAEMKLAVVRASN